MDMNIETSHVVEVSTAPSSSPKKLTVPLINLERFPTQQEIEGQDARNRRPVRPIDRQRMRPWLMELLDMGNVFGLRWTNRHLGIFQISWRHASRLGWNLETDGDVFERWARHTGIYKEGDPPEPKRWKANFRCALHSLTDVLELTNAVERRGRNACRTYQFLQNSSSTTTKSKAKKQKTEVKVQRNVIPLITYEQPPPEPEPLVLLESASSDDILSETESEGSQKDKVIVQRLEAKSQDAGEDFILHHDHDYSAGPLKTQKTIYLRQGVGSIVLQKEVQSIPEDGEVKSYLLSNLDQLASAAVSETITAQKSPASGTVDSQSSLGSLNRISPTKTVFDLTFNESSDKTDNTFKNLLPRLRARLKESGKVAGTVRKRKGSNFEVDLEDLDYLELKGKVKREKVEKHGYPQSPPSPPLTRRRSGSPKKAVKVVAKSKRTRKESEESTSDSTEPLMSSCLLLLEAATRLDNAEKNGGSSGRSSSKANKKGTALSQNTITDGKRRTSGRILRFDKQVEEEAQPEEVDTHEESFNEERLEIVIQDGIQDTAEVSQEMIIEEEVYPDNAIQVVYEVEEEQPVITETEQSELIDSPVDSAQYHEILRTALENIGSELEVSTVDSSVVSSSPKEMAIMRRKKDIDRTSSQNVVESPGHGETSFPKGLFSGSEIITENQQPLSIVRKRIKGKSKSSPKDNIYYVDIRANGGSISVKQSDEVEADEEEPVSSPVSKSVVKNSIGIQQTVIKRELPVLNTPSQKQPSHNATSTSFLQTHNSSSNSSQIFIAAAQNTSGQQIIVPISSGGLGANSIDDQTHILRDSNQPKQLVGQSNQGGSFITLGPHGKTLLYKSDSSGKTLIPLLNPVVSSSIGPNVKISTLPIVSSVKPLVNISAPGSGDKVADQTVLTTNSATPFNFVPKMSQTISNNTAPTQLAAISSGGKAWILQPRKSAPVSQASKAATIRMMPPSVKATDQTIITIPGVARETGKSSTSLSSANPSTSVSILPKRSDDVLKSETTTTNVQVVNMPSEVVIEAAQGSALQPSLSQLSISALPTSSLSHSVNGLTAASEEEVVTSPSTSLCSSIRSESHPSVPIKNEVDVTETVVISGDLLNSALSTSKGEYEISNTSQVSLSSSLLPVILTDSITTIKEEIESGGTLTKINTSEENVSGLSLHSSPDLITARVSQESEGNASTYQIIESVPDSSSSTVAFDVIVKPEANDQQVFVSPEQGEHIAQAVHVSQTMSNETYELSEINTMQHIEPVVVESAPDATAEEICLEVNTKEQVSVEHHHSDAMSMDPRTPLAIGEIPLFASSKGDLDYMENPVTD